MTIISVRVTSSENSSTNNSPSLDHFNLEATAAIFCATVKRGRATSPPVTGGSFTRFKTLWNAAHKSKVETRSITRKGRSWGPLAYSLAAISARENTYFCASARMRSSSATAL